LSRAVLSLADCFFVFSLAISPFRPEEDDRECSRVGGSVLRLGLIVDALHRILLETIASGLSIVRDADHGSI